MKRLLLFSSAIVLFCSALPAEASSSLEWDTSDQCKTILGLDVVSPYVQKVLDRADTGLANAHAAAVDPEFKLPDWAARVGSAWAQLIDTKLRLQVQSDDLVHNTACMRFDLVSIECKMDQVRHEMNKAVDTGSFGAIVQLEALLDFLNGRYSQLVIGATDPTYQDPLWSIHRSFDIPDASFAKDAMCPYDSDYAPPQQNGYGCDVTVLEPRKDFAPLKAEYDALKIITDQLKDYRKTAQQLLQVQQTINDISGSPVPLPAIPATPPHATAAGCNWSGGVCQNDASISCEGNKDCGGNTCVFPVMTCAKNPSQRCTTDAACGADGPCANAPTVGLVERRGPFSILLNHFELLRDFLTQRVEQGNSRVFKDDLKRPSEFPQSAGSSSSSNAIFITDITRELQRSTYALWSRIQGEGEADIFPVASDPALEIAQTLLPLRQAIADLAKMTTKQDGDNDTLRGFVIKFASFLRRSCTQRPCNASLEAILKIAFTDECFPYANGQFLNDSPGSPRSELCTNKAGITLP